MQLKNTLHLKQKIFSHFQSSPKKSMLYSIASKSFYASPQPLTLPYLFGNTIYLVKKADINDPNMIFLFNQILKKNSYIQGFERAYCHHLGNIAFNQTQILQSSCDELLYNNIDDGINQIEEMNQKLILISTTGRKPYTSTKLKKTLQLNNLPFSLSSEIVDLSILSTPIFSTRIQRNQLIQIMSHGPLKMYAEKGNIFQIFGKMVQKSISFKLVLQITLKVQTDLILQSVSNKKSPSQINHSGPEMHFIQFQGEIKQFDQQNLVILAQALRNAQKFTQLLDEQFDLSNILITDFDNNLNGRRWKIDQAQNKK